MRSQPIIFLLRSPDDAAKLDAGTVKITRKKSAAQGRIGMKLEKDKKTVTVTAAKGTKFPQFGR